MTPPRLLALLLVAVLGAGCASVADARPRCRGDDREPLLLLAQAVPSAAYVPCTAPELPEGWSVADLEIHSGLATMQLRVAEEQAGSTSKVTVRLAPTCAPDEGRERPSGVDGVRRFDLVEEAPGRAIVIRTYRFDGGCVRERYDLEAIDRGPVLGRAWAVLGLVPVEEINREAEVTYGRPLRPR